MSLGYHLLTTNPPLTVAMDWDGGIERPDKFVTDLFESFGDISRQFRTYDIRVIAIFYIQ
jgi:hypothetical protein